MPNKANVHRLSSRVINAEIERAAADFARAQGITKEQAVAKLLETDPSLYAAYRAAHRREGLLGIADLD